MAILDIIGNPLTTWVEIKDSPEIEVDSTGAEVVRRYRVAKGSSGANIPSLGTADAEYSTATLRKYRVRGTKAYPEVECIYRTGDAVSPVQTDPAGTIILRSDSGMEQVPIEAHPNFKSKRTDGTTGAVIVTMTFGGADVDYPGLESYLAPRPIFSYVETVAASGVTWNEATIIGKVGQLGAPPNMAGSPTATKWLQIGRTMEQRGDVCEIGESFQYHPDGYSGKVYRDASGNYTT
jgi:hypothetical protein